MTLAVGSVQMRSVFFLPRFRELGVRDGEMSPLSFLGNQMIILKDQPRETATRTVEGKATRTML